MPENFKIDRENGQLACWRWRGGDRSGGPVVVLLHAGVADSRSWREVLPLLPEGLEVVAYDRRGFGESEPSREPFTHADDLLAVLGQIADGPAWLVGSSAGGGVALDAALLAPDRVAGLVLFAPAVGGAPPPAELDPDSQRLSDLLDAATEAGDLDEVCRLETWIWLDGPGQPEGRVSGPARELAVEMNLIALRHQVPEEAGGSGLNAWSRLGEIAVPAVVSWGDLDLPALIERSRELARRLPRGRPVVTPGTAHLPYLERPAAVAEVISTALAS